MATVVNNSPATPVESDNSGVVMSLIVIALVLILLLAFGLPMLRGSRNASSSAPTGGSAPQVNVPGKIDVNVNKY